MTLDVGARQGRRASSAARSARPAAAPVPRSRAKTRQERRRVRPGPRRGEPGDPGPGREAPLHPKLARPLPAGRPLRPGRPVLGPAPRALPAAEPGRDPSSADLQPHGRTRARGPGHASSGPGGQPGCGRRRAAPRRGPPGAGLQGDPRLGRGRRPSPAAPPAPRRGRDPGGSARGCRSGLGLARREGRELRAVQQRPAHRHHLRGSRRAPALPGLRGRPRHVGRDLRQAGRDPLPHLGERHLASRRGPQREAARLAATASSAT